MMAISLIYYVGGYEARADLAAIMDFPARLFIRVKQIRSSTVQSWPHERVAIPE